jgi:immune inhibitor A
VFAFRRAIRSASWNGYQVKLKLDTAQTCFLHIDCLKVREKNLNNSLTICSQSKRRTMSFARKMWLPLLLVTWLVLCYLPSFAMPPHPDLEDKMRSGEVPVPKHLLDPRYMQERGIEQPILHPASEVYPTGTGPVGTFKTLALLVRFSDNPSSVNASFFDTLIFENQNRCVRHYYQEVSYGLLDIVTVDLPSTVGWNMAPQTYAYYVNGNYALGSYPHNSQKLVEDLADLVDPFVDFSEYDNDSDGYVDALIVVHAGTGAELTRDHDQIWSHMWGVTWSWSSSNLKDGVRVWEYTIQPEYWYSPYDMTLGVYCHELGHIFGLPDLYDYGNDSYGVGRWSLMAYGAWNGSMGNSPAHPDAWCMTRLGYVTPTTIVSNTIGMKIPNIENSPVAYKVWTSGSPANEYFLVANTQRVSYDLGLPHSGLTIWHVDESISDYGANDNQWYPGYTSYGHYKVALEQSDGLWQLEKKLSYGNSGDPYPGYFTQQTFNGSTTPNSNDYAGTETYVAVTNISNSGDTMTCDISVSPADVKEDYAHESPSDYFLKQNYPNPFNPQTKIEYFIPLAGHVRLEIFNVLGEKVQILVDERQERGTHVVSWNGNNDQGMFVSNGIYFFRLSADNFEKTNRMLLLK